MESAQLTKAHEHVRNAATATYSSSVATAGVEHELAASAFHEAAHDTQDAEALRILALLEEHHLKLARLIKDPPQDKEEKNAGVSAQGSEAVSSSLPQSQPSPRTQSPSPHSPTRAPSRRRLPQSSIASNLAEKRGIPGARRSTPNAPPMSITTALASRNEQPSTPVRDLLQRQSREANEANKGRDESTNQGSTVQQNTASISPPPDDNFRRFYSTFSGVIQAISAPLAFTSLPLNPTPFFAGTDKPPASPTKQKPKSGAQSPEASRTVRSSEPDLTALISKPALRALREDQGARLGPFANNESFYFVPTSGGTVSYANILREQQAHAHHAAQDPHLDSIAEGENEGGLRGSSHEEFVDARETVGPPSPTSSRRPRSKGSVSAGVTNTASIRAGRGQGLKTMEELQLENETLRGLIDKQAKRLSMWEITSQSSYNALAQSFRARTGSLNKQLSDPTALAQALAMGSNAIPLPSPPAVSGLPPQFSSQNAPTSPSIQPQSSDPANAKRIAELEALVASQTAQIQTISTEKDQLARQNEKNAQVIGRYREQWEKLKAGARKKEQERRERRLTELKSDAEGKDSESGEAAGEGDEALEGEEPTFGKA